MKLSCRISIKIEIAIKKNAFRFASLERLFSLTIHSVARQTLLPLLFAACGVLGLRIIYFLDSWLVRCSTSSKPRRNSLEEILKGGNASSAIVCSLQGVIAAPHLGLRIIGVTFYLGFASLSLGIMGGPHNLGVILIIC